MGKINKRKSVTWEDQAIEDFQFEFRTIMFSGKPEYAKNFLAKNFQNDSKFKDDIIEILKDSGLTVFFRHFGVTLEKEGNQYVPHKRDFCKLLHLVFKEVGVGIVKDKFNEMNKKFIALDDPGFPQEVIDDVNRIEIAFLNQQHSSPASTSMTEPSAEAKEDKSTTKDDGTTNTLSFENFSNHGRAVVGPLTEKLQHQTQENIKKKIHQGIL